MSEQLEELHYGSTDYEVDVAHIAKESGTELVTPVLQAAIDAFCLVHNSAITERPITAATSRNFINERTGFVPPLQEVAHYGHDSYDDFGAPFEHEEGFYSIIVTEERATLLLARHTAAFKFALGNGIVRLVFDTCASLSMFGHKSFFVEGTLFTMDRPVGITMGKGTIWAHQYGIARIDIPAVKVSNTRSGRFTCLVFWCHLLTRSLLCSHSMILR
jgi:hypothetical protein